MSAHHFTIRINLDALRSQLARALQRTILLVAAGLQNIDRLDPAFLELPVSFKMILDPNLKWTKEETESHYSEWVLSNGFRDAVEAIGALLEETHRVLSIWDLTLAHGQRLSGAQWNKAIVSDGKKFHGLGLPHKLDHLRSSHGIEFDERLYSHVLSINRARNCLVHRKGIVTQHDTDTASLAVTWRKLTYVIQNEDGEKALQIGQHIEAGDIICIRHDEHGKSFRRGEVVRFTAPEFTEVCWSLFLFGEDLMQKMNTLGIRRGILKDANSGPIQKKVPDTFSARGPHDPFCANRLQGSEKGS